MKIFKSILIIIFVGIFLYFYIYFPHCKSSYELNEKQKYFSIANTYTAVFTSILGLLLGSFYYFDKLKKDKENKKKEKRRKQLTFLLDELNSFDNYVDQILNKQFNDKSNLEYIRNKISRSFEIIEMLILQNKDTLSLNDEELNKILEVNSFVDKSNTIMYLDYKKIIKLPLFEIKDIYIEKIKDAKRICFLKAE